MESEHTTQFTNTLSSNPLSTIIYYNTNGVGTDWKIPYSVIIYYPGGAFIILSQICDSSQFAILMVWLKRFAELFLCLVENSVGWRDWLQDFEESTFCNILWRIFVGDGSVANQSSNAIFVIQFKSNFNSITFPQEEDAVKWKSTIYSHFI